MLTILQGDVIEQLRTLPNESVHCCVTSPPYWGLRDYATEGQIGLEATPEEYVRRMVEVFREVRRVLRKDGTLWLNLGDSYASDFKGSGGPSEKQLSNAGSRYEMTQRLSHGLKPKDLCGIPWRVAFALQADGWWLRSDIIWAKPNPMPESVTDRPTKAHEYLFLLTKSANYFYDAEAIKEPQAPTTLPRLLRGVSESHKNVNGAPGQTPHSLGNPRLHGEGYGDITATSRNKRSVWTVATAPYPEAHFATYPPDLIKPCILAGTSAKGCCAKCGSPWERIIERGENESFGSGDSTQWKQREWKRSSHCGPNDQNSYQQAKTIGWQPTCKCKIPWQRIPEKEIPCTVLDPFAGSGTTGAVALELGRKAILIELNPKYVQLIEKRCNVTMGLALA